MKKWKVAAADAGERLVNFVRAKVGDSYSARKIKQAIEHNHCKVNDYVERYASVKLKAGDVVQFNDSGLDVREARTFVVEKERILYEDETLFIYNKPAGITSDLKGLGTLFPGYILIHRLDRDTSGAIAFAKNRKTYRKMIDLFRDFQVKKAYIALVDGAVKGKEGVIENHIGLLSKQGDEALWGVVSEKKGNYAKTRWNVEKRGKSATLVKCFPMTGRTHQIRVHLCGLGHPILGDFRYAKKFDCSYDPKRTMLHALELSFVHPETGERVAVKAPIPKDFKEAMKQVI